MPQEQSYVDKLKDPQTPALLGGIMNILEFFLIHSRSAKLNLLQCVKYVRQLAV